MSIIKAISVFETMARDAIGAAADNSNPLASASAMEHYNAIALAIDALKYKLEATMVCPICGEEMHCYKSAECGYALECEGECEYMFAGGTSAEHVREMFRKILGEDEIEVWSGGGKFRIQERRRT